MVIGVEGRVLLAPDDEGVVELEGKDSPGPGYQNEDSEHISQVRKMETLGIGIIVAEVYIISSALSARECELWSAMVNVNFLRNIPSVFPTMLTEFRLK